MNFLRENEVDFECSFDGNDDGELQSTLDYFIQKVSNGLQRRRKRGKFPCSLVNNMSKQTSKKKRPFKDSQDVRQPKNWLWHRRDEREQ